MGAVGYDLKPVKRVQLVSALQRLEAKFSQRVHRVLVVEDDPRQRESIHALLGHADVQIVGVDNARAALEQLRDIAYREAATMAYADAFRTIMLAFLVTTPLVLLMRRIAAPASSSSNAH